MSNIFCNCIFTNNKFQGCGGSAADEMGLGKTVQSVAFLEHLTRAYLETTVECLSRKPRDKTEIAFWRLGAYGFGADGLGARQNETLFRGKGRIQDFAYSEKIFAPSARIFISIFGLHKMRIFPKSPRIWTFQGFYFFRFRFCMFFFSFFYVFSL